MNDTRLNADLMILLKEAVQVHGVHSVVEHLIDAIDKLANEEEILNVKARRLKLSCTILKHVNESLESVDEMVM